MLDIIYQQLSGDAALTASVNAIRPIVLEQGDELPAITYQRSNNDTDYTFEGESGFKRLSLTVNLGVNSLIQSNAISKDVKRVMYGMKGVHNNITIHNVFVDREVDNFQYDDKEYQTNLIFIINYKED